MPHRARVPSWHAGLIVEWQGCAPTAHPCPTRIGVRHGCIASSIVLAVAAWAQQRLASPATTLQFDVAWWQVSAADVRAFGGARDTATSLERAAQFSIEINECPGPGPVWDPDRTTHVWDAYGNVIKHAELAHGAPLTPEQTDNYHKQWAVLHEPDPAGGYRNSPTYTAYKDYRRKFYEAAAAYAARHDTTPADLAKNPPADLPGEVQTHWRNGGTMATKKRSRQHSPT